MREEIDMFTLQWRAILLIPADVFSHNEIMKIIPK